MRTLTPDIVTGPMSSAEVAANFVPRAASDADETEGLLDVSGTFDVFLRPLRYAILPRIWG
jgi:hypothetical protein